MECQGGRGAAAGRASSFGLVKKLDAAAVPMTVEGLLLVLDS